MFRRISCVFGPLLLAACVPADEIDDPSATASQTPEAPLPPGATSESLPVGGARQVSEETDLFIFEYSYPQAAGEIVPLARWLDVRLDRERNALATRATQGQEEARDNGFPFNTYSDSTRWEVVANLPDWLSLSADLSSYTGGAHPNYGFDTIVWDKQRNIALEPIAFFTSPAALDRALGEQLCEALNRERERRRGRPVEEHSNDPFDSCVKPDETNLLLGSTDGALFNRIGIQIAPYLAGPYAEGSYEFTFPVTAELLQTVREEYRGAFAARN
ncbi:DUF4163 domain-containing protein [Aurantiacibacter sp. MUD11]|uniref:DUF4163 domain-containing protein n=1 Tax=Aurantiacibacter sp. MUD11 TaxID=3003265 RepID=UPI0022AB405E|nr:DUF4163 domain-containing protein [Aurantiacibacter sp. MUD11]WAT19070.1 DUF4163 domain-containing protein [Aurantiacibacter sp. MUD11]